MLSLTSGIISTNNLKHVPALLSTAGNVTNIYEGDAGMSILSKKCTKCGEVKDLDQFTKDKRYADGRYSQCKSCKNGYFRDHYQENQAEIKARKLREYHANRETILAKKRAAYPLDVSKHRYRNQVQNLKQNFGISIEQYQEMFDAQGGVCSICGKPETAKSNRGELKMLAVDHDHKTGKIRGLLCQKCNNGIGHFEDNGNLLLRAIRYLRGKR
jgi:hypothetical protein